MAATIAFLDEHGSYRLRSPHRRLAHVFIEDWDSFSRFGELSAELEAFEWLELRTLGTLEPGTSPGPMASVLKLRASRLKQDIAALGVEFLGESALRWRS